MARRVLTQTFGVVAAIIVRDGRILLVKEVQHHKYHDGRVGPDDGKWNHPAGWIEVGENPLDGVVREVREETGYDFRPTGLLGVYSLVRRDIEREIGATPHPIKLVFLGDISEKPVTGLSDDVSEARWFSPAEVDRMPITELRDLCIKQMFVDYRSGRRYPLDILRHTVQIKT